MAEQTVNLEKGVEECVGWVLGIFFFFWLGFLFPR